MVGRTGFDLCPLCLRSQELMESDSRVDSQGFLDFELEQVISAWAQSWSFVAAGNSGDRPGREGMETARYGWDTLFI